jgi:hypothetical protein
MSYLTRTPEAAQRNGFFGWSGRYLSQMGSWSTYASLSGAEQIPERLAQVTAAYLGLKGLVEGQPRLAGTLGVIVGVHALEYLSAGAATTWMRLFGRGRPLGTYRGITIRQSPAANLRLLNRLAGGRLFDAGGAYFSESGKTWAWRSWRARIGSQFKTLTRLHSYGLPRREFWFDRPILLPEAPQAGPKPLFVQRVVDTVMGYENPEAIPGFIGSINELEDLSGLLGNLKRGLFLADWLLRDEGEREGASAIPDYEALVRIVPTASTGDPYCSFWPQAPSRSAPTATYPSFVPSTGSGRAAPPVVTSRSGWWVSGPARTGGTANPLPVPPATTTEAVHQHYPDRLRLGGREYPLVIKRITTSPLTSQRKADALYFDDESGRWYVVTDSQICLDLARAVDESRLTVAPVRDWPETSY